MAPVIRALNKAKLLSVFVHCGQHYDYNMSQQFIENLVLVAPYYSLKIEVSSPGAQTAEIMMKMDQLLEKLEPSFVLVEGDTTTVLSAALAAAAQSSLIQAVYRRKQLLQSIRKQVLVIRLSTERQEAVEAGFVKIVGTDKNNVLPAIREALVEEDKLPSATFRR